MTKVWEEFFDLLRYMYHFDIIHLQYVKKYLYDFFEIAKKQPDELERKKQALIVMNEKAKKSIGNKREILALYYQDLYLKEMNKLYEELESDDERVEFLKMIYEGNLPPEVQALVDQNNAPEFTAEEIEQMQREALQKAKISYQRNGLDLSKGSQNFRGNVITASELDDFLNDEAEEEKTQILANTKTRSLPNLPSSNSSNNSQNSSNFQVDISNSQNPVSQNPANNVVNFSRPNFSQNPVLNEQNPQNNIQSFQRPKVVANSNNYNPNANFNSNNSRDDFAENDANTGGNNQIPLPKSDSPQFQNKFSGLRNLPK